MKKVKNNCSYNSWTEVGKGSKLHQDLDPFSIGMWCNIAVLIWPNLILHDSVYFVVWMSRHLEAWWAPLPGCGASLISKSPNPQATPPSTFPVASPHSAPHLPAGRYLLRANTRLLRAVLYLVVPWRLLQSFTHVCTCFFCALTSLSFPL